MKMLSFAIIGLFVLNTNFLKIKKISPGIAKNSFIHERYHSRELVGIW